MTRLLSILITALLLVSAPVGATVFKIATVSPDGSSWMQKMRQGAREVAEQTEGRVQFKFYPGGVMGSDATVLRKIRLGQLQGGALTGGSLASYAGDSQLYNLPLLFHDYDEVDFVRARMDPLIAQQLEQGGFVTFGLAEGGLAYLMSDSAVTGVTQLKDKKVWMPATEISSQNTADAFELNPIPLSIADVLPGLQTGLIDTITTSPIAAIALQWHTQVSHITNLPLSYFYAVLAIDKKAFARLSDRDQQQVRQVMERVFHDIDRQNRKDNIGAFRALQAQGIKLSQPSRAEIVEWRRRAHRAITQLLQSGELSRDLYRQLAKHLDNFRNGGKAQGSDRVD
ncbi:TRAP transporter substrate-binding protein [Marinobacterium arenosum]|uniref:TRAP transporter substrate-binding protein n=1 Tax=Marinobacterium arenosum TaxID=2862496 RepID=UPI001C96E465|nr:TRAP transporter substrate-binding protein DctP [Marinobacterium arenosum]MBY4675126.1 TRAP transporter substrate-binding protein DctP [Marinobacterium arenosum]